MPHLLVLLPETLLHLAVAAAVDIQTRQEILVALAAGEQPQLELAALALLVKETLAALGVVEVAIQAEAVAVRALLVLTVLVALLVATEVQALRLLCQEQSQPTQVEVEVGMSQRELLVLGVWAAGRLEFKGIQGHQTLLQIQAAALAAVVKCNKATAVQASSSYVIPHPSN